MWTPLDFQSIFSHFSSFCMKGLKVVGVYSQRPKALIMIACKGENNPSLYKNEKFLCE